jgi:hypothetical protein
MSGELCVADDRLGTALHVEIPKASGSRTLGHVGVRTRAVLVSACVIAIASTSNIGEGCAYSSQWPIADHRCTEQKRPSQSMPQTGGMRDAVAPIAVQPS